MPKILEFDESARRSLERGVDALAYTVTPSLVIVGAPHFLSRTT